MDLYWASAVRGRVARGVEQKRAEARERRSGGARDRAAAQSGEADEWRVRSGESLRERLEAARLSGERVEFARGGAVSPASGPAGSPPPALLASGCAASPAARAEQRAEQAASAGQRPERHRKKPVAVDAMRWDGTAESAAAIAAWSLSVGSRPVAYGSGRLEIPTLEGVMAASPGDWVVCGVENELYPCKPSVFAATYEPAGERSAARDAPAAGAAGHRTPGAVLEHASSVELVVSSASDSLAAAAARVSVRGAYGREAASSDEQRAADEGLIGYLVRSRHGVPFEHCTMTFRVETPLVVARELMRHRLGSYSEESGRYRVLGSRYYAPPRGRDLVQTGKPGEYRFERGTDEQADLVRAEFAGAALAADAAYRRMLGAGVAREVARMVLPLTTYTSLYATYNARSLMNLLSLRTAHPGARTPSHPMAEIQRVAEQMEALWAELMPATHRAFCESGRVAP